MRARVAGGGFAAFDAAVFETMAEDEEELSPRAATIRYLSEFIAHVRVLHSKRLAAMSQELGELLADEDGQPVRSAVIVGGEGEDAWQIPLTEIDTSDRLTDELYRLRDALADGVIDDEDDGEDIE